MARKHNKNLTAQHLYILMNKPLNYVCSTVSDRHKTVYSLIDPNLLQKIASQNLSLHTVGRLDSLTTGLLLLTTDGVFSHKMTIPQEHISKTYMVTLEKTVPEQKQNDYIENFKRGVLLPAEKKAQEYFTKPAILKFITQNQGELIIFEGKFHQVRRMFASQNNCVKELKRIAIGGLTLPQDLKEGEYRILDLDYLENEINFLNIDS